jgi:hypothetical protein
MKTYLRYFFCLLFFCCAFAHAEWLSYSDPTQKGVVITYSTLSIKRIDEIHFSVSVFTNYPALQTTEINRQKIQYQSKTETQFFGCETQDFALGAYELYRDKDAMGPKTSVPAKDLQWNSIAPGSLQMQFLSSFCRRG